MTDPNFTALARELNFYAAPNSVFGVHRGYQVSLVRHAPQDKHRFNVISIPVREGHAEAAERARQRLVDQQSELGFTEVVLTGESLLVISFEYATTAPTTETLRTALERALDVLEAERVPSSFETGFDGSYGHYVVQDTGVILKTSEYRAAQQHLRDERERSAAAGYGRGVAGAIVGGMIGVVAWVALAYFTGYITSLLAFVIAFLSWIGWQQLGGKVGVPTKPLLVVVNLLLIVVASFLTLAVELRDYGVSVGQSFELLLLDVDVRNEFMLNTGLSLVFAIVGIWYIVADIDTKPVTMREAQRV